MLSILCFSPAGATKTAALMLANNIAKKIQQDIRLLDVTQADCREKEYHFSSEDILIAAVPTYAGRIPNKIMPFYRDYVQGNGCTCVTLVTFGNRSEDSSLTELTELMKANGCKVLGACAIGTRHVMSRTLGEGRLDEKDTKQIADFAEEIVQKLQDHGPEIKMMGEVGPYYMPLREDGEKATFLKAKPKVDESRCVQCGKCAQVCPMGSIKKSAPFICEGICIKCHACIRACEQNACYFDDPDLLSHIRMLEKTYAARRADSKFYL